MPDVEGGGEPGVEAIADDAERLPAGRGGAPRDFELEIALAKLEIRRGYVGDEREDDGLPRRLARQQLGARRLARTPQAPPHVELERGVGGECVEIRLRLARGRWKQAFLGGALSSVTPAAVESRQLVGSRQVGARPRLIDSGDGDPQVFVRLERGADEPAKLVVLEELPPGQVRERSGLRLGWGAPPGFRNRDRGTRIVRAERAAR